MHRWCKHEMIQKKLRPPVEQIHKAHLALRALKDVGLLNLRHWQATALGGQGISGAGQRLLLREQTLGGLLPLR